ncbi:myoD family inhibitor-like [Ornithorhynchus anatinus]|uniref:myoD family inhibitor-like n=1 Tax=Ornithorhynchus anatinus TaxID=9258 RepID=UPI0019D4BDC8|nr:myoD family inhibitor-like [Ornithorhynchus anatinus]XP_039768395.1 myoD family inhibitor-like [Ornithorhynchus anatinus]XP_039768396.1 myoD family inhibitor-like [Ornithorhynchus anatinus]
MSACSPDIADGREGSRRAAPHPGSPPPHDLASGEDAALLPAAPPNGTLRPGGALPREAGAPGCRWKDGPGPVCKQPAEPPDHKAPLGSTASVNTEASCKSRLSTASRIQEVAGDDRCAHCILACLFCEFLSLCSLALECVVCGGACGGEPWELRGPEPGGGCACGPGCGVLQDCCGSADCLELCTECCSICFPA